MFYLIISYRLQAIAVVLGTCFEYTSTHCLFLKFVCFSLPHHSNRYVMSTSSPNLLFHHCIFAYSKNCQTFDHQTWHRSDLITQTLPIDQLFCTGVHDSAHLQMSFCSRTSSHVLLNWANKLLFLKLKTS